MTININQFDQKPAKGELDLQISKSGVISAVAGANWLSSAIAVAGDPLKFDVYTSGVIPQFIKAAYNEAHFGFLIHDVKKDAPVAGDAIQVALEGVVIYVIAKSTNAAGDTVEQHSDGTYQTYSAGTKRGIAIDPGVAAGLFRMLIKLY
jgi:hypothetical protein